MQGKGKSRTYSGTKTLKRCWNTGEADNVVLIDVDSDNMNGVIIIDVPESLEQKLRVSRTSRVLRKDRKCQLGTIIYIDDDESSDASHSGTGAEGGVEYYSDASSSGRFVPSSEQTQNSVDAVGDECQFVRENLSPLKSSKYKRTYSGISSSRNCYDLGPDLDSGTSDNECPDCEFMEDSFGKLREQWEKANMKKKYEVHNGQSARGDEATTSGLCTGTQQNSEVENMINQHTEAQFCPSSSNTSYEEESLSFFVQRGFENFGNTSSKPKKTSFADFGLKSTQETQFSDSGAHYWVRGESIPFDAPLNNGEGQTNKHVKHGSSRFSNEQHCSRGPSLCSSCGKGNKLVNHTDRFPPDKEKTVPAEPCQSNPEPTIDISFSHCKASLLDEEVSFFRTQYSVDHGREKFQQTPSCDPHFCNEFKYCRSSKDKGKSISGKPSFQNINRSAKTCVHHDVGNNEVGAVPEETSCEGPQLGKSGLKQEKRRCQNKVKRVTEEPSLFSVPHEESNTELNVWAGELSDEFMSNGQQQEKDGSLNAQDGYVVNAVQDCIINEREKLKETDEYKKAAEKEWTSRQRELQLQAEEAQKLRQLRKRKKAESMRLLDMERRQKQRVEEMRDTQKKDEENLNLKEQLRAEIKNEINRLDITCRDMASLLRGLGIHVGGGFQAPPTEVRAAYKRALLSFHPDRASGLNIRQLVEAEEKFKLISRMKEKFLSTS